MISMLHICIGLVVIALWLGGYTRMIVYVYRMAHFSSKKTIHLCFIHTSVGVGVKYNKTLKALPLHLYEIYSSW